MRGTRVMGRGGGGCRQAFRRILRNIPGNVLKDSGDCPQTFWGMSSNILNVIKHSLEFHQTFRGIPSNKHRGLEMML